MLGRSESLAGLPTAMMGFGLSIFGDSERRRADERGERKRSCVRRRGWHARRPGTERLSLRRQARLRQNDPPRSRRRDILWSGFRAPRSRPSNLI